MTILCSVRVEGFAFRVVRLGFTVKKYIKNIKLMCVYIYICITCRFALLNTNPADWASEVSENKDSNSEL